MSNTCKKCGHWNGGVVLCEHYAEEAERREQERQVGAELKQLIEDAAKLLGAHDVISNERFVMVQWSKVMRGYVIFNPCDPERGDLMKVADAAELDVDFDSGAVFIPGKYFGFTKGDHESLALAILRAASAVLHSRGD